MKTYDGNLILRTIANETVLVDDNGSPPSLGETVTLAGRTAEVVASNAELQNDSATGGRFIAVFQ